MTATATLFNLATASLSPTAINLGQHHVGGALTQALTLANTAATGSFSENLDAGFSGASGLTDSGSVSLLKAGLSSTALGITLAGLPLPASLTSTYCCREQATVTLSQSMVEALWLTNSRRPLNPETMYRFRTGNRAPVDLSLVRLEPLLDHLDRQL